MRGSALACVGVGVAVGTLLLAACTVDTAAPSSKSTRMLTDAASSSSDGSSSSFDASSEASESGDAASAIVDAGPPAVQFIGRFDTRESTGPKCAWPGCRIRARFEGTSASVDLEELAESWMEGAPSEWDVAVDGVWGPKIVTSLGTNTYPIATGLGPGVHQLELYRRSEAQNGVTRFVKLDLGGGSLLSPPLRSNRRIEVIGDSSTTAFGTEGVGYPDNDCPGIDYGAQWQNFRRSFGALLGEQLDAEVHGTAFAGKGLVKNVWRPDTDTIPLLFPLINPLDPSSTYDFAWTPDVVIVTVGGNDFAYGAPDESNGKGPATPTEFTDAYRAFVATLRSRYPNAHLFLNVSPGVTDEDPAGRNTRTNIIQATSTVAAERNAANDAKVHAVLPLPGTAAELSGCNGHGTPALHIRLAEELRTIVKQKTGW